MFKAFTVWGRRRGSGRRRRRRRNTKRGKCTKHDRTWLTWRKYKYLSMPWAHSACRERKLRKAD